MVEYGVIALIATLGAVSPGPDLAIVTKNSLVYGRSAALWTAIGIGLGIIIHVSYCVLGVALLIAHSLLVFNVIKLIGALYLIYIGSRALVSGIEDTYKQTHGGQGVVSALVAQRALYSGFLTNVLNPKCTLFMLSIFTVLIQPHTPVLVQIIYGIEIALITTFWFALVAFFLALPWLRKYIERIKIVASKLMGTLLVCLGFMIIFQVYISAVHH